MRAIARSFVTGSKIEAGANARLPVEVLGAVLNGVTAEGEYQYYGYSAGYGVAEPEVAGQLT